MQFGTILNDYIILGQRGECEYDAKSLSTNESARVLVSDPGNSENFIKSADAQKKARSANVVPVREIGVEGGCAYMATDLQPGKPLYEACRNAQSLSTAFLQIAKAAEDFERCGAAFMGVSPESATVTENGKILLCADPRAACEPLIASAGRAVRSLAGNGEEYEGLKILSEKAACGGYADGQNLAKDILVLYPEAGNGFAAGEPSGMVRGSSYGTNSQNSGHAKQPEARNPDESGIKEGRGRKNPAEADAKKTQHEKRQKLAEEPAHGAGAQPGLETAQPEPETALRDEPQKAQAAGGPADEELYGAGVDFLYRRMIYPTKTDREKMKDRTDSYEDSFIKFARTIKYDKIFTKKTVLAMLIAAAAAAVITAGLTGFGGGSAFIGAGNGGGVSAISKIIGLITDIF